MAYTITLLKKEEVAAGTMAFYFTKPEGFEYRSGQSIDLTLINPPETDAEGNTRAYSLTSAPHEEFLSIATRLRDTAFKLVLRSLPEGAVLTFEGPFGSMTLHNDISKPAVFLAGGIGITPFFSMAKSAAQGHLPHKIFLFYSNRSPQDAPFLKELQALQEQNPNFHCIPTMTAANLPANAWAGERGYITKDIVLKHVPGITSSIGYLAGPPGMVAAMRKLLNESGLDNDYIRSEEFTGY